MHKELMNQNHGRSRSLEVGPGRLGGLRPLTGLVGALSAALWLCAGCIVDLPAPDCDHDGDGYCSEAIGNMPGGDCCDQLGDIGCGDATQPETIYPGAPETCADIGIDNDCDWDAEEVDGLGDLCDTGICSGQANCPCQYGHLQCEAGELICDQDTEETLDEPCNGVDNNCNGKDDSADDAAHDSCGPDSYCVVDECVTGCQIDDDCGDRGNHCLIGTAGDSGRCICGDGPEGSACPDNFVCEQLGFSGYACICGANTEVCGPGEGCSVNGICTCGNGEPGALGEGEACDSSNAPDCNTSVMPNRCDCSGEPCETYESCCGIPDRCVDTNDDTNHCGHCFNECHENEVCCSGICSTNVCSLE